MTRYDWTQNICERCWFIKNGDRFPSMMKREEGDFSVDICAYCGTPTVSGIFVRDNPINVDFPRIKEE